MRAFITATGTDIGKTHVTCGLIRALRGAGEAVRAYKPLLTGYDPADPEATDPARLIEAGGGVADAAAIAALAPFRFAAPLSPDWAAALEGRRIDFGALLAFCRGVLATPGAVLIEGIGGVMVPIDDRHTVLDWIAALDLPAVLVAGSYLGTLSHTLTALAVLRARCVRCVVVISESAGAAPAVDATADIIATHGGLRPVIVRREASGPAAFDEILQALR